MTYITNNEELFEDIRNGSNRIKEKDMLLDFEGQGRFLIGPALCLYYKTDFVQVKDTHYERLPYTVFCFVYYIIPLSLVR